MINACQYQKSIQNIYCVTNPFQAQLLDSNFSAADIRHSSLIIKMYKSSAIFKSIFKSKSAECSVLGDSSWHTSTSVFLYNIVLCVFTAGMWIVKMQRLFYCSTSIPGIRCFNSTCTLESKGHHEALLWLHTCRALVWQKAHECTCWITQPPSLSF